MPLRLDKKEGYGFERYACTYNYFRCRAVNRIFVGVNKYYAQNQLYSIKKQEGKATSNTTN